MRDSPKVIHVMVGHEERILADYFEKHGDYVNYNYNTIFKKISTKRGTRLFTDGDIEYFYDKDETGCFGLVMFNRELNKEVALETARNSKEELRKSFPIETLRKARELGLQELRPKLE